MFFCFQAEDGIRDLVRSRGLGDVYKRQVILKALQDKTIAIRTEDGKEQSFEVRPLILERLSKVSRGQSAVLLIDEAQQVADVSFNHSDKGSPSTH
mgnify:CR=1 FL=1